MILTRGESNNAGLKVVQELHALFIILNFYLLKFQKVVKLVFLYNFHHVTSGHDFGKLLSYKSLAMRTAGKIFLTPKSKSVYRVVTMCIPHYTL